MSGLNLKETFNKLNASHRTIYEYELFTTPVSEFWYLDEILSTVNDNVPKKAFKSKDKLEQILRESTPKQIYSRKPAKLDQVVMNNTPTIHNGDDVEISQYLAWALMKYIGESTIFQQEYFLIPNSQFSILKQNADESMRIQWRAAVTKYEKYLNGILNRFNSNIESSQHNSERYSGIRREINAILYDKISTYEIRAHYHIPTKSALADHMNYYLLYAYGTLLRKIVNDFNASTNQQYGTLKKIALSNAATVREHFGPKDPIYNFTTKPVSKVIQERNRRELEFAKQYGLAH